VEGSLFNGNKISPSVNMTMASGLLGHPALVSDLEVRIFFLVLLATPMKSRMAFSQEN
jgi:hypothetical protein